MDDGRQWALETFGTYGPWLRDHVAEAVRGKHVACLNAQDASGHRAQGVYGQFWRGILERFEEFGQLPGAELIRPGNAPYRIPVVNGVALFPWRYAHAQESRITEKRFNTSDARNAMSAWRPTGVQEVLDVELPDPGLTSDDREMLEAIRVAHRITSDNMGSLVVVAISSSVRGLFDAEWGRVELRDGVYAEWVGFHESLVQLMATAPAAASTSKTFTDGEPPKKFPQAPAARKTNNSTDV